MKALLDEMVRLDRALGDAIPVGPIEVDSHASGLVLEYIISTRRTFGSAYALHERTLLGDTNRTEDAATLLRKMMNALSIVFYVSDYSGGPELNALRSERTDLLAQRTAVNDILEVASTPERRAQAAELDSMIQQIEGLIESRYGADELKRRPAATDIFREVDHRWMIRWRYESDIAHLGSVGRATGRDGLQLGVGAAWERTANVIALTIGVMTSMIGYWVRLQGREYPDLLKVVQDQSAAIPGLERRLAACT